MIVQELYKIQNRHGYLPRVELEGLAQRLATPLYRIEEVVSFFPHFRKTPPPDAEVHVCIDMACHLRGGEKLVADLKEQAAKSKSKIEVCGVSCLGRCDRAVAVRIFDNRKESTATGSGHGHAHEGHGHDDHEHEPHTLLNRSLEDIVAVMNGDKSKHNDRDADLPNISATWRINELYANKPPEELYAAIKRFVSEQGKVAAPSEPEPIKQPPAQEVKLANPDKVNAKDAQVEQAAHPVAPPQERVERRKPTLDRERQRIIDALTTANLLGMGGAGGRAYKKWTDVNDAKGDIKYVVCNGDESEPGTFKDREILLRTPHLVVESMTLAGLFLKAERGYIYIRHEFEEQIAACRAEIERAKKLGVLGNNILGSDMSFQLEVFVSPGGYICGEQTALIQAIQDQRAEPRNRPPDLQTNGLWDKPTLVNNVETFAWVPSIVERDNGKWFAAQSTRPPTIFPPDSNKESFLRGSRFFSVSGDVNKPAAVEVQIGIKIKDLIAKCGGMKDGKKLLAIALSGPSGGFTPAKLPRSMFSRSKDRAGRELVPPGDGDVDIGELELDIDLFRQWNIMMGAGIIVYAEGTNLIDQAVACLKFYKRETCGKCVPCRIGSTRMAEWGEQIQSKQTTLIDIERFNSPTGPVQELALTMRSTAICGLGSIAFMPLTSLLKYFPDQIANHLKS